MTKKAVCNTEETATTGAADWLKEAEQAEMRDVQQFFIAFKAELRRPADQRRNGSPLCGHHFRQVQQFLILLPGPLSFLDTWI